MSEFSQFISDIPPGISVLGGAIIALAGVFLTNVWNLYRLKKQFDYERTIRTDDRRADLRSELFLQTSEAVTIAVQTLGSIPNLEVAHDEIMRPFIERAPAFGKLNLIADIELVEKVSEFTTTVTSSMLELSALRLELESIQLEVQMFSKQLAEHGEERGRMLEYMKQYNIEGRNNPTQFDVLSSNYEREAENANEALEKFSDANERLFKRRMEVTEHSSSYLSVVSQLAIPIVAQMRKELGLAFDQTRFEKLSEDAVSSQQAALQKLIGDVGELAKKEL